jgi:hypothetical protein
MTALDGVVVSFPHRPLYLQVRIPVPVDYEARRAPRACPRVLEERKICYPLRESNRSLSETQPSSTLKTQSIYFSKQLPTFCQSVARHIPDSITGHLNKHKYAPEGNSACRGHERTIEGRP